MTSDDKRVTTEEAAGLAVVLCNFPDGDAAARAARTLVEERLAACVNILTGGVRSIYRWQGQVMDEAEVTCLIKTTPARLGALRARLLALHPYQVPEIVALPAPAAGVNDGYLAWVRGEVDG